MKSKVLSFGLLAAAIVALCTYPVQAQSRPRSESVTVSNASTSSTAATASSASIFGYVDTVVVDVSGGTQTVTLVTADGRTVYSGTAITSDKTAIPRVAVTDTAAGANTNLFTKIPVVGALTLGSASASVTGLTVTATIYYTPESE